MRQITPDERKKLSMKIVTTAEVYGREIDQSQLQTLLSIYLGPMFDSATVDQICYAFDQYTLNIKNTSAPFPAKIREIIIPADLTDRDVAVKLVRDIIKAVRSYQHNWQSGYYTLDGPRWYVGTKIYTTWAEAAKDVLGDLGVAVVTRFGWSQLCDFYFEVDESMFTAQVREYIEVVQRLAKTGDIDRKFELPQFPMAGQLDQPRKGLESMGSILSSLVPGGEIKTNDHAVTVHETAK